MAKKSERLNSLLAGARSRVAAASKAGVMVGGDAAAWQERARKHMETFCDARGREEQDESFELTVACMFASVQASADEVEAEADEG